MANSLTFTTPAGENVTFALTAQADGSTVLYSENFTTFVAGAIYLKVYETGDAAKASLDPANLVEGTMYDVEAFSDAGFTTPIDITTWGGTNITYAGYTVAVDRRPMYVGGYATGTQGGSEITFGCNTADYRKTPLTAAPDADFTDPTKNGRIDWIDNNAANAIAEGIERVNYSNPAGWTSVSNSNASWPTLQGNYQPHYPSIFYTGMSLTEATLFAGEDTTAGAITWDTPFTVGGYSNSDLANKGATDTTPGDQKKAWAAAVQYTKDLINAQSPVGAPEVICYGGYRPLWTDKNQTAFDKTLLGYSKVSTEAGTTYQWSGLGSSPGWTPEPGWDGVGGTANSSDTFNDWFAEELAGAYSLGFTAVGLDTGANVWKHAGGMSNSGTNSEYTNAYNFSDGNGRIIDVFNSYGLKPMFESVALDRWTHMNVNSYDKTKLVPMTGNDGEYYKQAATWAQAFTWWGYVRDVNTDGTPKAIDFNEFNNTLTGWQASGGSVFYVNGVATIGDPLLAGAGAFSTTESEVHAVFRWGSDEVNAVLQQTDGWILLKQMMYDFHSAGLIVSAASNTSTTYHGVTAAEFLQFVVSLHSTPGLLRPTSAANNVVDVAGTITTGGNPSIIDAADYTGIPADCTSLQIRGGLGFAMLWNTQAERDAFISSNNIVEGDGVWTLTLNGTTYTAAAGWTWDDTTSLKRLYILESNFATFPNSNNTLAGWTFSVQYDPNG